MSAMEPKQIIVMRTDLNMRKGKMIAQGAHASMKVLVDHITAAYESSDKDFRPKNFTEYLTLEMREWLEGKFTKICVRVNSEAELRQVYEKAVTSGVLCSLIEDAGLTEFKGVPTLTCCAIGPEYPDILDPITGHLDLL